MNLLIVGAGGMGREIFCWLQQEIKGKNDHRIVGFLDDDLSALDNYSYPVKIVGSITDYQPKVGESLVLAVMSPKVKKDIVSMLVAKGAEFYTLIHPSVIVGYNVKINKGCVVAPLCILTADIVIGGFVFLNANTTIGHDVVVKKYCSINGKAEVSGNVTIGANCLMGVGAKIIPKRNIGDYVTIGAGSVVIRHVRNNASVFGNPAKEIITQ